jgi:hypothetical protein
MIEWDKFRRYASWMRRLYFGLGSSVPEEVLRMISLNSLNGTLCPGLRVLTWVARSYSLPFHRLFISPHLTTFSFRYKLIRGRDPDKILPNLTSMIAELQTSSLQSLEVDLSIDTALDLNSTISSAVLRCGPSLTTLSISVPLSDAVIQRIVQLPELTTWTTMNGPPRVSDSSPSDAFPKLSTLHLHTEASVGWISFLGASAHRASSGPGTHAPSNRGPSQQLITLVCWVRVSVNANFTSHITQFHGLVNLVLESSCSGMGGCTFGLTDDDVAEIATALPNLADATFGDVCAANSCQTTVSSLLFFSTRCKNLEYLEIHFNTTNICDDLKSISENPRFHDLRAFPRCQLKRLSISYAPLRIRVEDYGPVAAGFLDIFPSLCNIGGTAAGWYELSSKLCDG